MAFARKGIHKDGTAFYEIRVSRGRDQSYVTMRWDVPDGWSEKSIQNKLNKVMADFEKKVKTGEIKSLKEQKKEAALQEEEEKKLKTVKQYAENVYMNAKETTFSENTRANYQMFLNNYVYPAIGEIHIKDVTPAMITRLLLDFQKTGKAHASCIKLYNILNGIFEMAFMDDSIPINPLLKVRRPTPRKDEKIQREEDKSFTVDELKQLLDFSWDECEEGKRKYERAKKEDPHTVEYYKIMYTAAFRWYVFLFLAIDSGARRGELTALQWGDIDWKQGTITIQRNGQYTSKKGTYITTTKNGKVRTVDIGEDTVALLKQLRTMQSAIRISKWIFSAEGSDEMLSPQSVTQYFKRFGDRHTINNVHPHIFRHSSASVAITNGADIVSVSARLGHSDTAVTLRMYAHANEESIRRAGQTVRDALKSKDEKETKQA